MAQSGTCIVAQSGGPTAVINSSLCGVVDEARHHSCINRVFGALNGIEGVISERFVDLSAMDGELLRRVRNTPGAILGGCRHMIGEGGEGEKELERVLEVFAKHRVRCFIYIGGNDSMDTALKVHRACLAQGRDVSVIGVPKTVDNDLAETDHSPGFGSAAKYVATSVLEAGIHASGMFSAENVVIVETVGRNTGWLAAASVLAKRNDGDPPHLIYLPEVPFSFDGFLEDVSLAVKRYKGAFVVVGEGIRTRTGEMVGATSLRDPFGHPHLGEAASNLARLVRQELGLTARFIKLDLCQQSAMHFASLTDWEEAYSLGKAAVRNAIEGLKGAMVTLVRKPGYGYECSAGHALLEKVANVEKPIPDIWLTREARRVHPDLVEYVLPLIQGEVAIPMKGGLPDYGSLQNTQKTERRCRECAGADSGCYSGVS